MRRLLTKKRDTSTKHNKNKSVSDKKWERPAGYYKEYETRRMEMTTQYDYESRYLQSYSLRSIRLSRLTRYAYCNSKAVHSDVGTSSSQVQLYPYEFFIRIPRVLHRWTDLAMGTFLSCHQGKGCRTIIHTRLSLISTLRPFIRSVQQLASRGT